MDRAQWQQHEDAQDSGDPQHRRGCDQAAGEPGRDRRQDIAGVVERLVAADPRGEVRPADKAEADRGDRCRQGGISRPRHPLRQHNRPERRPERHHRCGRRHEHGGGADQRTFGPQHIDQRTHRRARQHAHKPADGQRDTRASGVPMARTGQVHRQEGADAVLHVG
jgi:hypothetical protein